MPLSELIELVLKDAGQLCGLVEIDEEPIHLGKSAWVFTGVLRTGVRVVVKLPSPSDASSLNTYRRRMNIKKEGAVSRNFPLSSLPTFFGCDDSGRFLVREFAEGVTVKDIVERGNADWQEQRSELANQLYTMGKELFREFHKSREKAYVLGDIKPANIVACFCGGVKFIDLGGVHKEMVAPSKRSRLNNRVGSGKWLYKAPEKLLELHASVDRRSDFFSLGASAYFCVVGAAPFSNRERRIDKARKSYLAEYREVCRIWNREGSRAGLPDEIVSFFRRCLHPRPEERPKEY